MSDLYIHAQKAKEASRILACTSADLKNTALENIAKALVDNRDEIIRANREDLDKAEVSGLAMPLLKRLKFDDTKIKDVTEGIRSLIKLDDPLGKVSLHTTLDDGLELYRVSCPIGVIGVIFESRPDALVQIASLCLKSGNSVFLKGGSEAMNTNAILAKIIYETGVESGLPEGWLHLITSRSDVTEMLGLNDYIDLIIPRGSNEFVQYIMKNTTIAVLGHADGVCHTYVAEDADIDMALKTLIDCKTQYVAVCNTFSRRIKSVMWRCSVMTSSVVNSDFHPLRSGTTNILTTKFPLRSLTVSMKRYRISTDTVRVIRMRSSRLMMKRHRSLHCRSIPDAASSTARHVFLTDSGSDSVPRSASVRVSFMRGVLSDLKVLFPINTSSWEADR